MSIESTQPTVTIASSALPTGASTASNQVTELASLATLASVVDQKGMVELEGSPAVTYTSANGSPVITATTTDVVAAPSSGHHLEVWHLHASNSGSTATLVSWKEASGTLLYESWLPQNGIVSKNLLGDWHLTTATKLQVVTSAAGSVYWTVGTRTVVD